MKNPFIRLNPGDIRRLKEAYESGMTETAGAPILPSPQTTIIGDLVLKMDRAYKSYTDRADRLTASIADMQEQLRQTRVTIAAIEAAMTTLADEVVLTPDERQAAKAAADAQFDEAVERELLG